MEPVPASRPISAGTGRSGAPDQRTIRLTARALTYEEDAIGVELSEAIGRSNPSRRSSISAASAR